MLRARDFVPDIAPSRRTDVETKLRRLRRHERSVINVRAIIHCGLASKATLICDMSDGGLGLVGADGLFPGCEVEIALVTGESKTGVVRWWLSGACGIQFHDLFESDDPFRKAVLRKSAVRMTRSQNP